MRGGCSGAVPIDVHCNNGFLLVAVLLLIVCYVKTLVDGAKAEEEVEVRKRSIVEMTST